MNAVADTSFVVAIENKFDRQRERCLSVYRTPRYIFLPQSVLNETAYLLNQVGGSRIVARFLRRLPSTKYILLALENDDIARTADLLDQYADSRVDFVDATVVAVAERLNITTILTLDHRDFGMVRPRHTEYFELQPK